MINNNISIQILIIGILIIFISLIYFILLKNDLDKLNKISRDTRFEYKRKIDDLNSITLFELLYGIITIMYGIAIILAGNDFFYHSFLYFIIIDVIGALIIISFKIESK